MKNRMIFLCMWVVAGSLSAQPAIQWQKTLGGSESDRATSIQQTIDGGFIMTGYVVSSNGDVLANHGGNDFWVVKLSELGIIQWQRSLGGSENDRGYSIQQTSDGGYIVAGQTESNDGDVTGNHGGKDCWIVRLNGVGVIQWQRTLGGSTWDEAFSVRQTSEGGYIVAGRSTSSDGDVLPGNHGSSDFWIVKLSDGGAIEWQKSLGGSLSDIAHSVQQSPDGGYIVIGEIDSNDGDVTEVNGSTDYWIVKLTSLGKIEWQRALGTTSLDRANDVDITTDGGYIIVGDISANNGDVTDYHGNYDYWAVKLDHLGEIQWQKALGGSGAEYAKSIRQTSDGGYVIAGATQSTDGQVEANDGGQDIWLIKLNAQGEIHWQKTIGGTQPELANLIEQTNDGGYIVAGYTESNNGDVSGFHGVQDFWIVKLAPETVGLKDPASAQAALEIYPNPANQTLSIKTPSEEPSLQVSISDLLGRNILIQSIQNGGSIDIGSLANGLYLVVATTPSGQAYSATLRKED